MTTGPAVVALIGEGIDSLGRSILSHEIASVIGDPDLFIPGVDLHPYCIA